MDKRFDSMKAEIPFIIDDMNNNIANTLQLTGRRERKSEKHENRSKNSSIGNNKQINNSFDSNYLNRNVIYILIAVFF